MAQTQSIYSAPLSGNLGNQTFKNYGGKQIVTSRFRTTSAKGSGASRAQRDTRMLMPNLTLAASQIKEWLPALWENNKFFKRPYTHFISHNMARELPVLPKELIDEKRSVWGELQISCGTLQPLVYDINNSDQLTTNIVLAQTGSLTYVSWGDISKSIISSNSRFQDGDSIVFVSASYEYYPTLSEYSAVCCRPSISALTLDVNSNSVLNLVWKGRAINLRGARSGFFGNVITIDDGAFASWGIVHVRKVRGVYTCSSQLMTTDFANNEGLVTMASKPYLDYCAGSWGYRDNVL